jgi:peptide-methionine (S)-S-oxide reductase
MRITLLLSLLAGLAACTSESGQAAADDATIPDDAESLVVAGGCFWCVESDFEKQPGVYEAVSGYSGGTKRDATYEDHAGHREVAEIYYDPQVTSYEELVRKFLRSIDVTDAGGQFCDRGYAYTTAIHYRTEAERDAAEAAVAEAEAQLGREIVTPVEPFDFFVKAEEYHQDYYEKNPVRYKFYRSRCGRDARVEEVWGDDALTH